MERPSIPSNRPVSKLAVASLVLSITALLLAALIPVEMWVRDEFYVSSMVYNVAFGLLECAMLFLIVVAPISGVVAGVLARRRIAACGLSGARTATAGIIVGGITLALELTVVFLLSWWGRI